MKQRTIELSSDNRRQRITLPVNPKELEFAEEQLNEKLTLLNIGEVNLLGHRGLVKGTISSFFPSEKSPFYRYADREPQEYIRLLKKWKNAGKPIRVIVTDRDINLMMSIDKLIDRQVEGDGDIYYTIDLAEYRKLNVPAVKVASASVKSSGLSERPNTAAAPKTVVVKSVADTLWSMACKYYGDGNRWTEIAKANGIANPKLMQLGDKVVIP